MPSSKNCSWFVSSLLNQCLCFSVALILCVNACGEEITRSHLFKDNREKLTTLQLDGVRQVQLHVVARKGTNSQVAAEITRRGGAIRFRADDIDYLRILFPIQDIASIELLAAIPDVEALAVSWSGGYYIDPSLMIDMKKEPPGPEPPTPLLSPYRPITDLDGVAFSQSHPNYDGRGVVIGMLDNIPDLLQPNLQRALDLHGHAAPKFIEATETGNAADDGTDKNWVRMESRVEAKNSHLRFGNQTYQTPHDGFFRLGLWPRAQFSFYNVFAPIAARSDRDLSQVPVLWDEATDTVWMDTNLDGSFADEKAIKPYHVAGDIGILGRQDSVTPNRESVGFTVTVDHESHSVRINLGWAGHGTAVAGSAAAEGFDRGKFDGVAGKAQLAVYQTSSYMDAYNVVETIYPAMKDPRDDLS